MWELTMLEKIGWCLGAMFVIAAGVLAMCGGVLIFWQMVIIGKVGS